VPLEPKTYESRVSITHLAVVQRGPGGEALSTDVGFVWADCPGQQSQMLRSGAEFSGCARKLKVGETVPVKVLWEWDEHGHYDWHVIEVGGCSAPPVDDDDSSFESVRECVPILQHDHEVGFHCNRVPEGELLQKCPWFKR
jgi:hypothetical protein